MTVTNIEVEEMANAGCNNGNYPHYTITFDNGKTYQGTTCACHRGCSNTDCLPCIGAEFKDMQDYINYLDANGTDDTEE